MNTATAGIDVEMRRANWRKASIAYYYRQQRRKVKERRAIELRRARQKRYYERRKAAGKAAQLSWNNNPWLLGQLENYAAEHTGGNRSAAARELIRLGIKAAMKAEPKGGDVAEIIARAQQRNRRR